jgi:ABC-2 type transport system permease protein
MAVSPFRALLAAHVQASVNRAFKELSKAGMAVTALVVVMLGLFIVLPLMGGALFAGWYLGSRLPEPTPALVLGLIATGTSLGIGVLNGLVGETQRLSWESYRSFPVRPRTLLAAELLAGLASLETLIPTAILVSLMVGLSLALPGLVALHLLVLAVLLSTLLLAQYLAGNLASALVRRHRATLLGLFGLCVVLGIPAVLRTWHRLLEEHQQALLASLEWLPGVAAMKGLEHAIQGSWGQALALQLPSLLLLGLLATGALLVARREGAPPTADSSGKKSSARGWSIRTPTAAIARLQWVTLLGSQQGKFGLVMPLITFVVVQFSLAVFLSGRTPLTVPAAFTYLFLLSGPIQFNQFGLDGHGVKALLLLPLSPQELLRGKALGLAAYAGVQCSLLVALLWLTGPRDAAQLAAGLLFAGCLFLIQNGVGQWTSAWMPRSIRRGGKAGAPVPLTVALIHLGASLAGGALLGGLYMLLALQSPTWLLAGMAAALGLCGVLHALLLPKAADYLRRRQETLVQLLG